MGAVAPQNATKKKERRKKEERKRKKAWARKERGKKKNIEKERAQTISVCNSHAHPYCPPKAKS